MTTMSARADRTNVAVCVATYKRPDDLAGLLDSLSRAHFQHPFRVIVVDNDPQATAHDVLSEAPQRWPHLPVTALHEPLPGIAAARNCGLKELTDADEFVVFVDDDETVDASWMRELASTQNRFEADIVSGPVESRYPSNAPKWVVRGKYHQRTRRPTGLYPRYISKTNNVMVRVAFLRLLEDPEFDNAFGLTGGSDTELFLRLRARRPVVAWCEEAVAREDVPWERLSFAWIRRRWIRNGNVIGRIWARERRHLLALIVGVGMMVCCSILGLATLPWRGPLHAMAVKEFFRGFGVIAAIFNSRVVEYVRS